MKIQGRRGSENFARCLEWCHLVWEEDGLCESERRIRDAFPLKKIKTTRTAKHSTGARLGATDVLSTSEANKYIYRKGNEEVTQAAL